jgi:nucleotide-binding universal stress UspA family protein
MKEDRTILVCYDGSPESEHALARTTELAHAWNASVSVISVADPIYRTPLYTGYADPPEAHEHRRLLEEARLKLADGGIAATAIERIGDAPDAIADAAREMAADLIVVGSRHRGLLQRLLFGSVSGELVVEAPCDVLVIR